MFASAFVSLALFTVAAQAGKRGLAWPWYNSPLDPGVFNNGDGEVVAIYDWETYAPPSTNGAGGLGFIGTQATLDSSSSPVADLAARQAAQGWATVFSLNEPDINGISPSQAASWYIQYINPLAIKKALPAVTNSGSSGQGLDWLQQMIDSCNTACYADYINLHWYGNAFSDFQSHVEAAHSQFPEFQIVVTEFALNAPASQAQQVAFFQQAFSFLDGASYIQLYFPFVATSPSLLAANDGGAVNVVGTGSCLFNNDGSPSAVGNLMY
ncbi:glycoside hydrolase family 128 protein [Athelia psychrophila]|uniref:Glycoside hydrolase family 128 protein n=1 Tax=Athelia psychrophila TaxID=1759441 RepID=A0A166AZN1_9AGAM|nr:glycoside hydrolase family 128 protein [Fibularhizoctonia sp. CBS 109695]KZP12126.1 glycoside hydrolase family 128 protein [Fibularhizoctonia sp. CBS 109695]